MTCIIPHEILDDGLVSNEDKIRAGLKLYEKLPDELKKKIEDSLKEEVLIKKEKRKSNIKRKKNKRYIFKLKEDKEKRKENNTKEKKKVKTLFDYYKKVFDGIYSARKLTSKRRKKIEKRLETFTEDELKQAIDNIRQSEWHIGNNPNGKVYATPDFIFRNDEKVEEWLNYKGNTVERNSELNKALRF